MDQKKYESLFRKIIKQKHGMEINFEAIEENVKYLRLGGTLRYQDLEIMADEKYWPFKKYWMWPQIEQIGEKLKETDGMFTNLPADEEEIIGKLDAIFKNIALVSIVLRFVRPRYYAIYSRPPLKILNIERGSNDVEEYMNYLNKLRMLKKSFRVFRTADMDMIVWALVQSEDTQMVDFIDLLAKKMPALISPKDLIKNLSNEPLKIAEIYFDVGDYETAGMWAGRSFEQFLNDECYRVRGYISKWKEDGLLSMVEFLSNSEEYWYKKDTLHKLRKLRNRAIHIDNPLSQKETKDFIDVLKEYIKSEMGKIHPL